jgi:hypothetical protein
MLILHQATPSAGAGALGPRRHLLHEGRRQRVIVVTPSETTSLHVFLALDLEGTRLAS